MPLVLFVSYFNRFWDGKQTFPEELGQGTIVNFGDGGLWLAGWIDIIRVN